MWYVSKNRIMILVKEKKHVQQRLARTLEIKCLSLQKGSLKNEKKDDANALIPTVSSTYNTFHTKKWKVNKNHAEKIKKWSMESYGEGPWIQATKDTDARLLLHKALGKPIQSEHGSTAQYNKQKHKSPSVLALRGLMATESCVRSVCWLRERECIGLDCVLMA